MPIKDHMAYIVLVAHRSGEYLPEQSVSELDRATVIKDIADGQYEDLRQVIEFNPVEHICNDVTEEICDAVCEVWADRGCPLTDWQYAFVEFARGTAAANAFARAA